MSSTAMAYLISAVKRKLSDFLSVGNSNSSLDKSDDIPPRKRIRAQTPMLRSSSPLQVSTPHLEPTDSILLPPNFHLSRADQSSGEGADNYKRNKKSSDLLRMLSNDVITRCISFIATKSERFSLQTTCKTFRSLSDSDEMLVNINLGGSWCSPADIDLNLSNRVGLAFPQGIVAEDNLGIITESDDSYTASNKLIKYAAAGNTEAIYMIAMILCYCHENIDEGVALLRLAREAGHLPSTYALSLILRDFCQVESDHCLRIAAERNYPPAWQEQLSASEMRAKFGEDLDAKSLTEYLDSPCLVRLLKRHYLECKRARKTQSSHCWNVMCGRWAYRAVAPTPLHPNDQRGDTHGLLEPINLNDAMTENFNNRPRAFSIGSILPQSPTRTAKVDLNHLLSPLDKILHCLECKPQNSAFGLKVSRMKMCSSCRRAKYCSKLCQTFDWRSGRHKMECGYLA